MGSRNMSENQHTGTLNIACMPLWALPASLAGKHGIPVLVAKEATMDALVELIAALRD